MDAALGPNSSCNSSSISAQSYALALSPCASYAAQEVEEATRYALWQSGLIGNEQGRKPFFTPGMHVLVKPNLLRAHELSCTHAQVLRAACLCLQEQGIKVHVADSPGFGTATSVAKSLGIQEALRPLGIAVQEFSSVQDVPLRLDWAGAEFSHKNLGSWGIARQALEADAILSLPKLKAHNLMGMSLGVKNLFGCICGLRKALAHAVQGRELQDFTHGILALYRALPPSAALMDGVIAMHKKGPSSGEPYALHCLAASPSAMALDTAIYNLLQLPIATIPLWQEAQRLHMPEAFEHNIHHLGAKASHIYPSTESAPFEMPQQLHDVCFQPHRLLQSFIKRLWSRIV